MSGTIVVGIDGSPGSVAALAFALDEARMHKASVKAVAVWHIPAAVYGAGLGPVVVGPDQFEKNARVGLEKTLEAAGAAQTGLDLKPVVRQGDASEVLVEEAQGADLLVVGTRGHGGFTGLLLGSVSQQCAHHATCPVAIVPNGRHGA